MIQMLKNSYEGRCKSYERVVNEQDACVSYLHIHIASVSIYLLFACLCPINFFSFKSSLIVHICPVFYENVNANASRSLQMFSDHLQMHCHQLELLTNILEQYK